MNSINIPKKLKAVFFDMDGVLYDSMPAHSEAWLKAMTKYGFQFSLADCYMNEGRTGNDTINDQMQRQFHREATQAEMNEIYTLKTKYFDREGSVLLMPFASNLLQHIKGEGRKIVLVTGSGQATLLDNLNRDFPDIFSKDNTVTAFDVVRGKPDPEPYLLALKKAEVLPSEAIVVENAPLGVQAAKAAGIFTVAVNTGILSDDVLRDFGADIVLAGGVKELFEKWETLFAKTL